MSVTGNWLAHLITAEQESLAATATAQARQQIPLYVAWPPEKVQEVFVTAYQVFARTCRADDIAPMRSYLKGVVVERLRAGATATDLMDVVNILSAVIAPRAEQERASDPHRVAEALRVLQSYTATIHTILTDIRLALINNPPIAPEPRP